MVGLIRCGRSITRSGGERTRTADFYVANVALYQLSYTPEGAVSVAIAARAGRAVSRSPAAPTPGYCGVNEALIVKVEIGTDTTPPYPSTTTT